MAPSPKAVTAQHLVCSSPEITGTNPGSSPPNRSEKIILTTWLRNMSFFRKLSRVSKDEAFSEGIEDGILAPQGLMESLHSAKGQDFMLYFQGVK